ncbi:MAG: hypothetical protein ACRDA5_14090 [Clostridium sp.]
MEKEILEILKALQKDNQEIRTDLKEIKGQLNSLESKVNGVFDQTADLTEFKTSVLNTLQELKEVEEVTKVNCYDIAKLKAVK